MRRNCVRYMRPAHRRDQKHAGDQRQLRRLSDAVGTDGDASAHHWRQSQCLSIAVGDLHRLRHLSVAVGTNGDASAHRWRRS